MTCLKVWWDDNHSVRTIQFATLQFDPLRYPALFSRRTMKFMLLLAIALTLFIYSDVLSKRVEASDITRRLTADSAHRIHTKVLLRTESDMKDTAVTDEERMGVKDALSMLFNAVKMKVKMKYWLFRGTTPDQVSKKLKIASTTDQNYKYYAKYFFKYYVKYPAMQPSNLPAKTAHDIMKSRLRNWLDENLTPPQVFKELGLTGTWASARGQPNYECFEQYYSMWSDLQVRLSKANS